MTVTVAASGLFLSILQQSPIFVSSLSLRSSKSSKSSSSSSSSRSISLSLPKEPTKSTITNDVGVGLSRRDLFGSTMTKSPGLVAMAIAGGTVLPWIASTEPAQAAASIGGIGRGPVAVVGASGRTGSLCVNAVRCIHSFIHLVDSWKGHAISFHCIHSQPTHTHTHLLLLTYFLTYILFSASGEEFLSGP